MFGPAVAIVPAFNEAPRVAAVVRPLLASRRFARVVVVDDGSTDGTADVALRAGAHVLKLSPNRGKGGAMLAGVRATNEPIVAFFDADMVNLQPSHVPLLLDPIETGRAVMVAGLTDYGRTYNALQLAIPSITGNRAVLRSTLDGMPLEFWNGFSIEAGTSEAACRAGTTLNVVLPGIKQVPKWQKTGAQRGILDAAKMTREVLVAMGNARRHGAGQLPWGLSPAGQAAPLSVAPQITVDSTGKIHGVDGMLDQIAEALARQARPLLQQDVLPALRSDRALQREVGNAIGRSAARELEGPMWLAAGALAVIAVLALVRAGKG